MFLFAINIVCLIQVNDLVRDQVRTHKIPFLSNNNGQIHIVGELIAGGCVSLFTIKSETSIYVHVIVLHFPFDPIKEIHKICLWMDFEMFQIKEILSMT